MNFSPPREFVWFVRFDEILSFCSFVKGSNLFWIIRFNWSTKKESEKKNLHFGQIQVQPDFNTFSYSASIMNEHSLWIHISQPSHWTALWTLRTAPLHRPQSTLQFVQYLALLPVSIFNKSSALKMKHFAWKHFSQSVHSITLSDTLQYFWQRLHRDLRSGFVPMSPARIARLVPFDELKRRNLSELLRLPSYHMLVKQCEDPSANTLLPILQSKFRSGESETFAHFQRMKPTTTTTGSMNGSFLTWNLTIFFCPIPTKPATILTPNSRDWWTKVMGKGPYLPMSFQSQGSDSVFAAEHGQLQGASQYSSRIFYKTYVHSDIWHSKNLQNTECDKLP